MRPLSILATAAAALVVAACSVGSDTTTTPALSAPVSTVVAK